MSRHRSRSPPHSRTSSLLGRRDGYYGEQYHGAVRSDPWRGSENVNSRNADGGVRWDNGSSQAEEQVDHWAKFIEAIGRVEKRNVSSMSKHHVQDGVRSFEEDSTRCPRQLPREQLSSLEASRYGMESHKRVLSPGQRRTEHDGASRHSQGKRHDRMEHVYHNEEHEDRFARSAYSERSLKSNYTQLHFEGFHELDLREEYTTSHRGFSPQCTPLIVEHDHGIPKHDVRILNPGRERERPRSRDPTREPGHSRTHDLSRDRERPRSHDVVRDNEQLRSGGPIRDRELPRSRNPVSQHEHPGTRDPERGRGYPQGSGNFRQQEHPRSRDLVGDREHPRRSNSLRGNDLPRGYAKNSEPQGGRRSSRSMERHKHGRDYNDQPEISHESPSGLLNYDMREDSRFHNTSAERGMRHHKEQPRMGSHSREPHGHMDAVNDRDYRMDEGNRASASVHSWKGEVQPRGKHGGVPGHGNNPKRNLQQRLLSHPGAVTDFAGHETLKIKVDMSRPIGQSSHLGYSSERQLSLDLVNVGRQRLDFLPMLEHSGTFRESAMHSGTFAQEIITLVHQVKENYFQGQGVTLNERFSNEQEYSLGDKFAEEEQDMEGVGPDVNRPIGSASLDTQIFCKIGPMQTRRKPPFPAPSDLRHDLERKRLERLEGVKITIAGANFPQMLPQSQENEAVYVGDEDSCEAGWSEEVPQLTEHWDEPRPKRPAVNSNPRRNFNRARNRLGQRMKRNLNNGPRW
ncbi:BCLAF1 and THRAP3 family member 3 [Silurus meridionalis]|nr:BCLAF1 and THRAP3 family member 3 [Silurus meridionalis]